MENKDVYKIKPIAYIKTEFREKFGIPRQSGRIPSAKGKIIFENEFNSVDAVRCIEQFSHLWLIFGFNKNEVSKFSPTVRPPRLGGNEKVGVFASRSPFRPNGLGLSAVKFDGVEKLDNGKIAINVSGVDLLNDTPIYDIKPYIPSADKIDNAVGGYADKFTEYKLNVVFPPQLINLIEKEHQQTIIECLENDPRPAYKNESFTYGMTFANYNIKFKVKDKILQVEKVEKIDNNK